MVYELFHILTFFMSWVLWYTFLTVYQTTSDHQPIWLSHSASILCFLSFPIYTAEHQKGKSKPKSKSKRKPVIYLIGPFDGSGNRAGRRSEADSDSIIDAPMEPNLLSHLFSFQAYLTNRLTTSPTFLSHHTVFSI